MAAPVPPIMGKKGQQGFLQLAIKDKNALYNAYMPFVKGGGLFIPTKNKYPLGHEVLIVMTLMAETEKQVVVGKVVWITPEGAQGNRTAGIGIQFNDKGEMQKKIETYLAGALQAERPTHTM